MRREEDNFEKNIPENATRFTPQFESTENKVVRCKWGTTEFSQLFIKNNIDNPSDITQGPRCSCWALGNSCFRYSYLHIWFYTYICTHEQSDNSPIAEFERDRMARGHIEFRSHRCRFKSGHNSFPPVYSPNICFAQMRVKYGQTFRQHLFQNQNNKSCAPFLKFPNATYSCIHYTGDQRKE